jgi:beta-lactamase class A
MIARRALTAVLLTLALAGCASTPDLRQSGALQARLDALVAAYRTKGPDEHVGVAVEDVRSGRTVGVDGAVFYPQQSVSKLWVAVTVLDQVDHGRLHLTDPVHVTRADMSIFNQPIQKLLSPDGTYDTTLDGLLVLAIAKSDNAADDILVRLVGGPDAVARTIINKRLGWIRASPEEKTLQGWIAGLDWRPEYAFGRTFWDVRSRLDPAFREQRLRAYLKDPWDGATPIAIVDGLARLRRGAILSPASTQRLLDIMASTTTGSSRLGGGLAKGWGLAHKTGTGQDLGDMTTGYNDVGLLTSPGRRDFAVAVMIASTRQPIPARQALMAAVTRAVIEAADPGAVFSPTAASEP